MAPLKKHSAGFFLPDFLTQDERDLFRPHRCSGSKASHLWDSLCLSTGMLSAIVVLFYRSLSLQVNLSCVCVCVCVCVDVVFVLGPGTKNFMDG